MFLHKTRRNKSYIFYTSLIKSCFVLYIDPIHLLYVKNNFKTTNLQSENQQKKNEKREMQDHMVRNCRTPLEAIHQPMLVEAQPKVVVSGGSVQVQDD
uniref:Uncharacterized protein n=1 Tax=Oryza brachyantha TaxID=4533 RepID=J3LU73_ORYBR